MVFPTSNSGFCKFCWLLYLPICAFFIFSINSFFPDMTATSRSSRLSNDDSIIWWFSGNKFVLIMIFKFSKSSCQDLLTRLPSTTFVLVYIHVPWTFYKHYITIKIFWERSIFSRSFSSTSKICFPASSADIHALTPRSFNWFTASIFFAFSLASASFFWFCFSN